ncbi:MAG: chondroitinase family polysaccharide lyase [Parvibaculales bacterium]
MFAFARKITLFGLLVLFGLQLPASAADSVTPVEERYQRWLTASPDIDYNQPEIARRYEAFLLWVEFAKNAYDNLKRKNRAISFADRDLQREVRAIFSEILMPLSVGYHTKGSIEKPNPYYHNPEIEENIISIYKYLYSRGFKSGIKMRYRLGEYKSNGIPSFGGSMGNNVLGFAISVFINRDLLEKHGALDAHLKTMDWITDIVSPKYDMPILWKTAGFNTDAIRSIMHGRFAFILSMRDGPEREKLMRYHVRLFNKSLKIATGSADMIKADYTLYHHKGPYLGAYGPSGAQAAAFMCYMLDNSVHHVNEEAMHNISKAVLAMRLYTNKYDIPNGINGRFPETVSGMVGKISAYAYLAETRSPYREELKRAFLRLWEPSAPQMENLIAGVSGRITYTGPMGDMEFMTDFVKKYKKTKPEDAPNGYWFYPYSGMGIYRHKEWMVSFLGISRYIWDFEASTRQNTMGRFIRAGVLQIFGKGEPISGAASGYDLNGWHWSRWPGATTPDFSDKKIKTNFNRKVHRDFGKDPFLGGISLDGKIGMSAIRFKDRLASTKLNGSHLFFDGFVLALATDLSIPRERDIAQTTLFQTNLAYIKDGNRMKVLTKTGGRSFTDEDTFEGIKLDVDVAKGEKVLIFDPANNAYLVLGQAKVNFWQGEQISLHSNGRDLTQGDFATARIIHGVRPRGKSYEYMIAPDRADAKVSDFAGHYKLLQKDKRGHIISLIRHKQIAYALFAPQKISNEAPIMEVDEASLVMLDVSRAGRLGIAVVNPDLGRWNTTISYKAITGMKIHEPAKPKPVKVTLKGKWKPAKKSKDVEIISSSSEQTIIRFHCFRGAAIKAQLIKG